MSGDINTALQWGVTVDDFQTSQGRTLFQHLLSYFQMPETSGAVLGVNALRTMYPTFQLVDDPSMTMEALCHELRQNRCRTECRQLILQVEDLIDRDPSLALNTLQSGADYLRRLQNGKATDVYADDAAERILHTYEMKELGVDLSICPMPWLPLQEATQGITNDDYIVLYGRPKSMKSWVLMYLIAWAFEQGKRILLYTKEMTADNVYQRILCIIAGVDYSAFRKGQLAPYEKRAMYDAKTIIKMLRQQQPMVCLSGKDAGDSGDTVPWLRSKIEEHKPDMCFIDGMYLMSDVRGSPKQKDNFRVQNISRDLRQTILDTGVPIIATLQANRDAAKNKEANLDEIAFSDAIGQDATLAMRCINEKNQPTIALMIGGSREFALDGFRIYGQPAKNFGYAGPISVGELLDAQRAEDAENRSGVKKAAKSLPSSTQKQLEQQVQQVDKGATQ